MMLIKIRKKISLVFLVLGLSLLLNGCGQSSSGGATNTNTSSNSFIKELSVDNMGTIPLLGTSNTRTLTWVHNNSDVTINNIKYDTFTNLNDNEPMLDPDSVNNCKSIKAHQSCPLTINGINRQKPYSGLIKLEYEYDGKLKTNSQSINFAPVATQKEGVFFSSNVAVSSVANNKGYGVFYAYATGDNQIYNISSLKIGNNGAVITNGNISNQQIQSGFVQAIEVSVYNANSSYNIPITVDATLATMQSVTKQARLLKNSNLKSASFLNTAYVSALPNNGAVLISSLPPILNTAEESNHSLYFVTNIGNSDANISDIIATSGITIEPGSNQCASGTLAAGDSCSVHYSVSMSTPTSSTNTISVNYTGGATGYNSSNQSIYWFNGKNSAMVSMIASANPVTFVQLIGTNVTITVTNVGGLPLDITNTPSSSTYSGSGVANVLPSGNSCTGSTLNSGATCSFMINVNDNVVEAEKQINVYLQGSYFSGGTTQNYSTVMPLYYTSTSSQPILVITPNPVTLMSVVGNDIESVTRNLIISNVGTETAFFDSIGLADNPAFMSTSNGDVPCGASLDASESCSAIVKLGPVSSATEQDGIAHYQATYTGSNIVSAQESNNIPWQVTPNEQSLTLTSVTASGNSSGTGSSSDPLIFSGSTPSSNQTISLQYTNTGTHALTISGFQNGNLGYAWSISSNSCTTNTVLEPSDTCTIVYVNNLSTYNQAAFGSSSVLVTSSYTVNLPVPSFVVIDHSSITPMQFTIQPDLSTVLPDTASLTEVRAEVHLATLTNTITINNQGTPGAFLTVAHTLANANGYPAISLSTMMENYFASYSLDTQCSANSNNGIMTEQCLLSPVNGAVSIANTYSINYTLFATQSAILNAIFTLDGFTYPLAMNTNAAQAEISQIP